MFVVLFFLFVAPESFIGPWSAHLLAQSLLHFLVVCTHLVRPGVGRSALKLLAGPLACQFKIPELIEPVATRAASDLILVALL
jgi:hypothetical protein